MRLKDQRIFVRKNEEILSSCCLLLRRSFSLDGGIPRQRTQFIKRQKEYLAQGLFAHGCQCFTVSSLKSCTCLILWNAAKCFFAKSQNSSGALLRAALIAYSYIRYGTTLIPMLQPS